MKKNGKHETSPAGLRVAKRDNIAAALLAGVPIAKTPAQRRGRHCLAALGREWLANSPTAGPTVPGLVGWRGPVGFVCTGCASRLLTQGCALAMLVDAAVWEAQTEACALCK